MGQVVNFSIAPDVFVRHVRGLVVAGRWRHALNALLEDIEGMTLDIAVGILEGKETLRADGDGFESCKQDPADPDYVRYTHDVAWLNAGIYEKDGVFYQPYARVPFDKDDETWALDQLGGAPDDPVSLVAYFRKRGLFHARNRDSDLVISVPDGQAVLFGRVKDPALWHKPFDDASEALEAYRAVRQLEHARDTSTYKVENDPRHWRFYERALRDGLLFPGSESGSPLGQEDREILGSLFVKRDAVELAQAQETDESAGSDAITVAKAEDDYEHAVLRFRIIEQARDTGGFIELRLPGEGGEQRVLKVPRAPFLLWAARDIGHLSGDLLPEWEPICPSGMKMLVDNPLHTDWWLGAGLALDDVYESNPVNKAVWEFCSRLAEQSGHNCVKLAGKGKALGQVVFPKPNEPVPAGAIAVVPFAGVDYELAMLSACRDGKGAVIAAVGGKLAHLATVGRELGARLVVVENAMTEFTEGDFVTVDADTVQVVRHGVLDAPQ